jgi:lipopolysaccharide export LptBFGC system permease protein LptF
MDNHLALPSSMMLVIRLANAFGAYELMKKNFGIGFSTIIFAEVLYLISYLFWPYKIDESLFHLILASFLPSLIIIILFVFLIISQRLKEPRRRLPRGGGGGDG